MNKDRYGELSDEMRFFFRFIKENGIYKAYIRYINNPVTQNYFQRNTQNWKIVDCAKRYGVSNLITRLIIWDKTSEGYDFWFDLHNKLISAYRKYLFNEKI